MRRLLAAAALAALTAAGAPAASASATGHITGGCFFFTVLDPPGFQGVYEGILGTASVTTYSATNQPEQATVTCSIRVLGVVQNPDLNVGSWSGNGVQVGGKYTAFDADDTDTVEICQSVVYANPTSSDPTTCRSATHAQVPPDAVRDVVHLTDPALCLALRTVQGSYGPVAIRTDGDVVVGGLITVYDCAPTQSGEQAEYNVDLLFGPWPPLV